MQTISTKYQAGKSRIVATASGAGGRAIISTAVSTERDEDLHALAAKKLCEQLDWHGRMVGGHTKDGMVFVFDDERLSPSFTIAKGVGA